MVDVFPLKQKEKSESETTRRIHQSDIPPDTVKGRHIAEDTITEDNMADDSVGTDQIAPSSTVVTPTLTSPTVTGTLSIAGAITQTGVADHVTLTPGASKLVKTAVLRQEGDATPANQYDNNSVVLTGWGFVTGDGASNVEVLTITFGVTFSAIPIVCMGLLGYKDGADPTTAGDFGPTNFLASNIGGVHAHTVTTGQFEVVFGTSSGGLTNGRRFGFTWIAIGTI